MINKGNIAVISYKKTRLFVTESDESKLANLSKNDTNKNLNDTNDSEYCRILGDLSHDHQSSSSSKNTTVSTDDFDESTDNAKNNKNQNKKVEHFIVLKTELNNF